LVFHISYVLFFLAIAWEAVKKIIGRKDNKLMGKPNPLPLNIF
jgi:hypothetical protein